MSNGVEAGVDEFFQEVEMPVPTVVEVNNELDNNAILVGEGGQMDEVDASDLPRPRVEAEDESEDEVQEVVYELDTSYDEEDEFIFENTGSEED